MDAPSVNKVSLVGGVIMRMRRVICVSPQSEIEGKCMKEACNDLAVASAVRIGKKESIKSDLPARFL
jgi:hypothetical protein